jgi:hypothetical protein
VARNGGEREGTVEVGEELAAARGLQAQACSDGRRLDLQEPGAPGVGEVRLEGPGQLVGEGEVDEALAR